MNLLLDTHVLLWWLADEPLSDEAFQAIAEPDNLVFVSAASVWEASIKSALGKLEVQSDLVAAVRDEFESLAISLSHAQSAGALPAYHRDPFDRMLVAQAVAEGLILVTRDRELRAYEVPLLLA